MTLEFRSIADAGDFDKERVVLKATSDDDIGLYALFLCQTAEKGVVAGNISHVYWFFNKRVKKEDLVILYSKPGKTSEKSNNDGTTSYFYYWGLTESIWKKNTAAVVVATPNWTVGRPGA